MRHRRKQLEEALKPRAETEFPADPVEFTKFLGFTPFPYQEQLLRDASKRVIGVCGRQVGKSTCAAVKILHFAVTHPKTTSIIVSATLRQSMETFSKAVSFLDASTLRRSVRRRTQTQIWFRNRSRIICLPSGRFGSTLRGYTVHFAVVDEAAFIHDEVITQVIFPMLLTTNGTLWMLTSPWDKNHVTYRCFTNPAWSVYHLPSAVNPLVTKEFLEEQRQLIGEERFAMEYLGQFVEDSNAFYPMTLIRPCLIDYDPTPGSGPLYGGYDPGGKESYAAFVAVERVPQGLQVAFLEQKRGLNYTDFTLRVSDWAERNRLAKLMVDQTGLGNPIVEHAKELGLPAEGLVLTQREKETILGNLKLLLEQRQIILPHNLDVINALNCITYTRTRIGGYTFDHRQGTWDDLAYALALACHSVKIGAPEGRIAVI